MLVLEWLRGASHHDGYRHMWVLIQDEDGDYLPFGPGTGHQAFDGVLPAVEPLLLAVRGQQVEPLEVGVGSRSPLSLRSADARRIVIRRRAPQDRPHLPRVGDAALSQGRRQGVMGGVLRADRGCYRAGGWRLARPGLCGGRLPP